MRRLAKSNGFQRYQRAGSPRIPGPKLAMGQKLSLVRSETAAVGLLAKVAAAFKPKVQRRGAGRGS